MKATLKVFVLIILISAALFAVVESYTRAKGFTPYKKVTSSAALSVTPTPYFINDSLLGFKHQKGVYRVKIENEVDFIVSHNTEGYRITSSIDTSSSYPELWILGSTIAHGWLVNDQETFPFLLQSKLDSLKVKNFAVDKYGLVHNYLLLKKMLKQGKAPKGIIISYSDTQIPYTTFAYSRRREANATSFLGEQNQPYLAIQDGKLKVLKDQNFYPIREWSDMFGLAFYFQQEIENYNDYLQRRTQDKLITQYLDEFIFLLKKKKIPFAFVNVGKAENYIQSFCVTRNIDYKNIAVDYSNEQFTYTPVIELPNSKGHQYMANQLYNFISEEWESFR